MSYQAPVKEMLFVINELAGLLQVAALPGHDDATPETAAAVLEEAARFVQDVLAPLNRVGDTQPSVLADGKVRTPPGFDAAFREFAAAGWQGLGHPAEYGGQGLPKLIGAAYMEMLQSANLSFALCPLLSDGAIEALLTAGSGELRERYVHRLVSGQWTGTMNLTEPQAGSDLALVRTQARPQQDGSFLVHGTKIFITYGDHDLAENILHLVLARVPGAPDGIKGLSLFLVPKYLSAPDGTLGVRNDVQCTALEHKLGIHGSPTAVMQYGEQGGAVGYLVGEQNRGLEYMFIMMNAARFAVGIQGVGIAERAYQQARDYARQRVQGRPLDGSSPEAAPIIRHPDVRRMLLTMRSLTDGARALAYFAAAQADVARAHADPQVAAGHQAVYEYLVPIVKGWSTEMAVQVASLGVQVHGGMGYIEETGAAQYFRDARILPIYEGTTAIQANDLLGRKLLRDRGAALRSIVAMLAQTEQDLEAQGGEPARRCAVALHEGRAALEASARYLLEHARAEPEAAFLGSVAFLELNGIVLSAWQHARALLVSLDRQADDPLFHAGKITTALFFARHVLPRAQVLARSIADGGMDEIKALDDGAF